jgi:hypothetical protein
MKALREEGRRGKKDGMNGYFQHEHDSSLKEKQESFSIVAESKLRSKLNFKKTPNKTLISPSHSSPPFIVLCKLKG